MTECAAITNKKNAAYKIALQKHKTRNAVEAHKKLKKEEKQTHWRKKREWETNNLEEIERLQRMKEVRKSTGRSIRREGFTNLDAMHAEIRREA